MAGFQIKLKADGVTKPLHKPKKTNGIHISATPKRKSYHHKNALDGQSTDSDEDIINPIDSFEQISEEKEQLLIIKPDKLNKTLINYNSSSAPSISELQNPQIEKLNYGLNRFENPHSLVENSTEKINPQETKTDDKAARLLLQSEDSLIDRGLTIQGPITSEKNSLSYGTEEDTIEYEKVPVDQFGAALLRGMGWLPGAKDSKAAKGSLMANRKKGTLLGIGAKTVEPELMEDLLARKGAKFLIPVIKRKKES
ncbi:uncharacterized protein PRCAT00001107001 [Priceomyces carsonii]|uniref:uncharacterized protein n=1 Tax=Priceomyces carsonii TaxID=28549 RepID=UPI002EDA4F84|nr:unnamed protein product [Priceomyces carsonii]